jgi:hypothetical protein
MLRFTDKDLDRPGQDTSPSSDPFVFSLEQEKPLRFVACARKCKLIRCDFLGMKLKSALFLSNPVQTPPLKVSSSKETMENLSLNTAAQWKVEDSTCFPVVMTKFANQTFKHVYETQPDYVEFMLSVTGTTGLFRAFQEYCKLRRQE